MTRGFCVENWVHSLMCGVMILRLGMFSLLFSLFLLLLTESETQHVVNVALILEILDKTCQTGLNTLCFENSFIIEVNDPLEYPIKYVSFFCTFFLYFDI